MTAMRWTVDLNADLGEGAPAEGALMPWVTSANIACGGHAGDAESMRAAVAAALSAGVAIGAHPGYEDRAHLGRQELHLPPAAVRELVLRQIEVLSRIAGAAGGSLRHVKPHGALYNQAARDPGLAAAIAGAVREWDARLILFGLAGSALIQAGKAAGLPVAAEGFADRTYQADGSLTPRNGAQPFVASADAAVAQVLRMVQAGTVQAVDGTIVLVRVATICLHGDDPRAPAFAQRLRRDLQAAGIALSSPRPAIL